MRPLRRKGDRISTLSAGFLEVAHDFNMFVPSFALFVVLAGFKVGNPAELRDLGLRSRGGPGDLGCQVHGPELLLAAFIIRLLEGMFLLSVLFLELQAAQEGLLEGMGARGHVDLGVHAHLLGLHLLKGGLCAEQLGVRLLGGAVHRLLFLEEGVGGAVLAQLPFHGVVAGLQH